MKLKKIGLITAFTLGIITIFTLSANAIDPPWYICNVEMAGPSGNACYVMLTDTATSPAFTRRWFSLNVTTKNQLLATMLTAVSSGQQVQVKLTNTAAMTTILAAYIQK